MGGVHLRYMLLNNCRNLVNQLLLQKGEFIKMKTHRKGILAIISIVFVSLLTSCTIYRPCRYFDIIIANNVMKVGEKKQVFYAIACHTEVEVGYIIEDENILEFDSKTFILTALNVGETRFTLQTSNQDIESVMIVVI